MTFQISLARLMESIRELGQIGALEGGGVCRLALTDEDKAARDWLVARMKDLGLKVSIDAIGNIWGVRSGTDDLAPVMIGSHIDTVATGGLYDGALGVLSGLEVVAALNEVGLKTRNPVAVAAFTNEEGARFAPDMMGSGIYQGALDLEQMLNTRATGGAAVVGDELARIGYAGIDDPVIPAAYFELHIEQGPVMEAEGLQISAVTGVQGIHWTEFTVRGQTNHAGTTPMAMRRDAGQVAFSIAKAADRIAKDTGGSHVATVGMFEISPGLVNVVPDCARFTVDMRNTDGSVLDQATKDLITLATSAAEDAGCTIQTRPLARFAPVVFDANLVDRVEAAAQSRQLSVRRMPSGAGHDAQMFAPNCPTAMIFIPSVKGLSHNIDEHSHEGDIAAGAQILFDVVCDLAGVSHQ